MSGVLVGEPGDEAVGGGDAAGDCGVAVLLAQGVDELLVEVAAAEIADGAMEADDAPSVFDVAAHSTEGRLSEILSFNAVSEMLDVGIDGRVEGGVGVDGGLVRGSRWRIGRIGLMALGAGTGAGVGQRMVEERELSRGSFGSGVGVPLRGHEQSSLCLSDAGRQDATTGCLLGYMIPQEGCKSNFCGLEILSEHGAAEGVSESVRSLRSGVGRGVRW